MSHELGLFGPILQQGANEMQIFFRLDRNGACGNRGRRQAPRAVSLSYSITDQVAFNF